MLSYTNVDMISVTLYILASTRLFAVWLLNRTVVCIYVWLCSLTVNVEIGET